MKKHFTFLLLFFSTSAIFSQPTNDDCSGLIDLGEAPICPVVGIFTNVDASESVVFSDPGLNIPACFEGGVVDRDVWFSFTVPNDGSVVDFTVMVTGVNGPNGAIMQPQVAIYRGDCLLDELQELDCAAALPGDSQVDIDLLGLTPGLSYFLRIADWTASATPNWGDFELCIKEYDPVFNMGEAPSTAVCAGTLFDSGGPAGDYGSNENLTFTICPQDFHQCIFINVASYDFENNFDFLTFYAGSSTNAPQITQLNGSGGGFEVQAFSECVTVAFHSDGSVQAAGFELSWMCSPDTCTIPPPSTCDDPTVIATLPFMVEGLTTCYAGNEITSSPCTNDGYLDSEDFIFAYNSPGDECIAVTITGSNLGTGVGIYNACPNMATDCIAQSGGGAGQSDPSINGAFLELPGTYYIVVDNASNCTPFNITVESVTCPIVFPSAALCEDALSLNGCGDLPAIISVAPGQGEAGFIQPGVNLGCWGAFFPLNFTWFFFEAQQDGEFGFVLQAANPNEASDIDFQIWGPFDDPATACDFAQNNEPIRSSYAAGADPTGLVNIHPTLGTPVTDFCEDAFGDDFVAPISVQQGEYYFVLVNDWGGAITTGAVSIDFGPTTTGVLEGAGANFQVSADTALCPGESAQLFASGGEVYQWSPADGLSCIYCPNPIATITQPMTYSVAINSVCNADTLAVEVGLLQVNAGPDQTICLGEEIQVVAGSNFAGVSYVWSGQAGFLSCADCPAPFITGLTAGTFTFSVTVTGPSCSFSDEMTLTVLPNQAPVYAISDDLQICLGDTVAIGGQETPGLSYSWTSVPGGYNSGLSNPIAAPVETTVYYLKVMNAECPLPSFDSVQVTVSEIPVIAAANDTTVCLGEPVALANFPAEPGVIYSWSPPGEIDQPGTATPTGTPSQTTVFILNANHLGCEIEDTLTVTVTEIGVTILNPDTMGICSGVSVPLEAASIPAGTEISWSPGDGSLNTNTGENVVATPQSATIYIAEVSVPGCVKMDTVFIGVDSLPYDLEIMPADTQICQGEKVLLVTTTYEPALFSAITFQWEPASGQLTPDSLFNMVVQPGDTTTYLRITTNGYCTDTSSATINVIPISSITVVPEQPVICAGDAVQLTATAPVPITFEWEPAGSLSCADCPNPTAAPAATTIYNISGEYEGCPVNGSVTVEVVPLPGVVFPNNVICPGETITLNLAPNNNYSYLWTSSDPGFASTNPAPEVTLAQTTTYNVAISNGICDTVFASVTIFVGGNNELLVSNDTTVCGSNAVTLFANGGVPGTYTWNPGGANGPSFSPQLTLGQNTYTVSFIDNGNCDTLTEAVNIGLVPGIEIVEVTSNPADTVYEGTTISLGVTTLPPATLFEWSNGGTASTTTVQALLPGTESWVVTVTDEYGCTDESSINLVILKSQYSIPNAFSPNDDELNQYFNVVITGENIEVLSLKIWNRWGQAVYQESNGNKGWDGRQNGKPAPSDVYIYSIVLRLPDGREVRHSGDVTLLR
ncbi:MAG: T9SS type B sorting domain-containing protein [Saprospiraceae bacterium]|nr:MAG: T9SS type B sorting domain-containing protein [Saprospiraceae bacterium]